jgi:hypothetical protein
MNDRLAGDEERRRQKEAAGLLEGTCRPIRPILVPKSGECIKLVDDIAVVTQGLQITLCSRGDCGLR